MSHVAVELARKIFGDLRDKNVLLVGAGKMSELAARRLVQGGARATVVVGRTLERADDLAARARRARGAARDAAGRSWRVADIVISGTGAPGIVIHQAGRRGRARRARPRPRPLFLIDIARPARHRPAGARSCLACSSTISTTCARCPSRTCASGARRRWPRRPWSTARSREFLDWQKSLDAVPLLVELRRRGDEIRRQEIEKVAGASARSRAEQEEALEAATSAIVNKLLHAPTVALKEAARDGHGPEQVSLIRRLLGL